jgi:hypothetical protein
LLQASETISFVNAERVVDAIKEVKNVDIRIDVCCDKADSAEVLLGLKLWITVLAPKLLTSNSV